MSARITAASTVMDAIVALGEGNPGALTVMANLVTRADDGGLFTLLELDTAGIYGPDIWVLYKDECGENLDAFIEAVHDKTAAVLAGE